MSGPTVTVYSSHRGEIKISGDAAREFIRKLEHPTPEELQERKEVRDRCRELAKTITSRLK